MMNLDGIEGPFSPGERRPATFLELLTAIGLGVAGSGLLMLVLQWISGGRLLLEAAQMVRIFKGFPWKTEFSIWFAVMHFLLLLKGCRFCNLTFWEVVASWLTGCASVYGLLFLATRLYPSSGPFSSMPLPDTGWGIAALMSGQLVMVVVALLLRFGTMRWQR